VQITQLNEYKKEIFTLLLERNERFYINILPVDDLKVGRRGITENEKQNGLTLIFSGTSYKNLTLDENYIYCHMKFNSIWEDVTIPIHAIHFIVDDMYDPNYFFRFKVYPITQNKPVDNDKKQPSKPKPALKVIK
jgi:hypothetical protein